MQKYIFNERPLMVYWELTRSCELACKHCRAESIKDRHPLELSTRECREVIDDFKNFGKPYPHLVLTGGDPLKRPDFYEIIRYARASGFPVSVAPSGTYNITEEVIRKFKELGILGMSLSLDGSTPEKHDTFRKVPGCFQWTIDAAKLANKYDLPLQINTLVCKETKSDLANIYELIRRINIMRWSLFFLIPVGRGEALRAITPGETENILNWLYDLLKSSPFPVKTTEAHHFRRIAWQRMKQEGIPGNNIYKLPLSRGFGVRDGNGIMFLSHIGLLSPSGFLPENAGNIREKSPVKLYRDSQLFREIRKSDQFSGKCGYCEYNDICGGSRARAWAFNGHYTGSDPLCLYQPEKNKVKSPAL